MNSKSINSIQKYKNDLKLTANWLLRSIEKGYGGSSASFSPLIGWSKPYPETTGYIIPTLFRISKFLNESSYSSAALNLGQWLLDIQTEDGYWNGGMHPNSKPKASVFNTGQILKGMMSLYYNTGDQIFLNAAEKGADWLASGVSDNGLWNNGDYLASITPSYYSHVAWPMLEVWKISKNPKHFSSAERFLDNVLKRRLDNGVISRWGFTDGGPAFTHTIAYTIRGFQESSRLIGDYNKYAEPMEQALNFFIKKSELTNGRIPGEFEESLVSKKKYVCLTGNAQLAICILIMEQQNPDLRLVNAAAKLIDFVSLVQTKESLLKSINGGVAGSYPLWGRYMFMRYPNWSAKYFCDSLMMILSRLESEL